MVRGGVEPPTFRFSGAYAASLHVAGCGLTGDLAGETVADCRLMWPDACRRWLPVWLPKISLAPLTFDNLSEPTDHATRVQPCVARVASLVADDDRVQMTRQRGGEHGVGLPVATEVCHS